MGGLKKVWTIFLILGCEMRAVQVQMPDRPFLQNQLNNAGYGRLSRNSSLIAALANKNLEAVEIAGIVERSIKEYSEARLGFRKAILKTKDFTKNLILLTLLEQHPEACAEVLPKIHLVR